jgi:hypothetical protein
MRFLNKFKFLCGSLVLLLALVMGSGSGQAFITIDHGDFSGATLDFLGVNETTNSFVHGTGIEDPALLYGKPTLLPGGNQLLFFPKQYSSSSSDGQADTTSGLLHMLIVAKSGFFIETLSIREFGDYSLTGGSGGTLAHPSGSLFITPLDGVNPGFEIAASDEKVFSDGSGRFSLSWEIDFTGKEVTMAHFSLDNTLQTSSEAGATAFVQKKGVNGPAVIVAINEQPVPLPGAAVLLGTGLLGVSLFRRKHKMRTN